MVWRSESFKQFSIESKTHVEKYMKVHEFFVLGILIFNCDWFLCFPLDNHLIIEKNNVFTHHEGAQISINENKNIEQWLLFSS